MPHPIPRTRPRAAANPTPDEGAIAAAITARLARSPWVELRTLGAGRALSFWVCRIDDPDAVARWAAEQSRAGRNVYATFNTIEGGREDEAARDVDVTARAMLFIDIDSVREPNTAATAEQRAAADDLADAVAAHLAGREWGEPAERVDTGNGAALYYVLAAGQAPDVPALLAALQARHGTPAAKVDTSVSNAARISRLPGTINHKGDGGRLCRVVSVNPAPVAVTAAMVAEAAAPPDVPHPAEPNPASTPAADAPGTDFNARGDWWRDVLTPNGAKPFGRRADVEHVTRPGKATGTSATIGHFKSVDGVPLLHVFTDAWPGLEPNKTYSKFAAFALLHHDGDFPAAAAALRAKGFGRAGAKRARVVVPDYRPFPVHCLPPVLRRVAAGVGEAVDCDPALAALPLLALAGAAVGAALVLSPKRDWDEPPALWAAVVIDSGTAKTPAAKPARRAAAAEEEATQARYARAVAEFQVKAREWRDGGGKGAKPVKPALGYFKADDVTIERLIENLATSPRGLLVSKDELAGWFNSFTRYKAGGGSDVDKWLTMFEGESVGYQRKTGEPREMYVPRALVSVSGGIQPAVLKAALNSPAYLASGLAARIVFAMTPKHCPRWSEAELSAKFASDLGHLVRRLRALPFDGRNPGRVGLSPAAKARFVPFHDANADRASGIDGGPMAAALPKLSRVALRVALIHHCATRDDPGGCGVGDESMAAGIELAGWFENEAERVYATFAESEQDAAGRSLRDLVRRRGGAMSARDLMTANRRKYRTADEAKAALDELAEARLGEWRDRPTATKPDRVLVLIEPATESV